MQNSMDNKVLMGVVAGVVAGAALVGAAAYVHTGAKCPAISSSANAKNTGLAEATGQSKASVVALTSKVKELEATIDAMRRGGAEGTAELMAIGPMDGRYRRQVTDLQNYFSEFALIKYRIMIEVEYFIELTAVVPQLASVPKSEHEKLRAIYRGFSVEDAKKVKATEKITNHDVKAVEYFIKDKFDELGLAPHKEFIHFGLTSQDINNTAVPLSMKHALEEVYLPTLRNFVHALQGCAEEWDVHPMLARTHGQAATPTRLGKEMMVFVERLLNQVKLLEAIPIGCKLGGATGVMAAHYVAFPNIQWDNVFNGLCSRLGLSRQQYTTQIEHYDNVGATCDTMARINTILIDYCRDMWMYVSLGYFTQTVIKTEVGSSAMPHKVNPINFENGEGNFGMANATFAHLSAKLPISRMQRDLSDSTVLRNIGVPFAHSILGIKSTQTGLGKMNVHEAKLDADLENNWAVVAEAIQTILRREAYPNPYEALKELTRVGGGVSKESIRAFVKDLNVPDSVKAELLAVTPQTYTGRCFVKK